jgi:hypothetical protein
MKAHAPMRGPSYRTDGGTSDNPVIIGHCTIELPWTASLKFTAVCPAIWFDEASLLNERPIMSQGYLQLAHR